MLISINKSLSIIKRESPVAYGAIPNKVFSLFCFNLCRKYLNSKYVLAQWFQNCESGRTGGSQSVFWWPIATKPIADKENVLRPFESETEPHANVHLQIGESALVHFKELAEGNAMNTGPNKLSSPPPSS